MRIRILIGLIYWLIICNFAHCRTPCGCVDWNISHNHNLIDYNVAPRVGAWIETVHGTHLRRPGQSRTPCGCVDWNDRTVDGLCLDIRRSHPVWVRGLKRQVMVGFALETKSHPVWVRGLKRLWDYWRKLIPPVAPRVGAWIETNMEIMTLHVDDVAPRVGAWIETYPPPLYYIVIR